MTTTTHADTSSDEAPARPLRKDAARNRELLLEAARSVFAERGLDASLDDIAHRAGLGVGTAYRHFANKQEVAAALFAQAIDQIVADTELALAIDDPWQALVTFFECAAAGQAKDRGLRQVMMGTHTLAQISHVRERLTAPVTQLFERARQAGVLRADAEPTDAGVILSMLGLVCDMSSTVSPELWRRYLAVLLDGLRATDQPQARLSLPTAALTDAELDAAMIIIKAQSGGAFGC